MDILRSLAAVTTDYSVFERDQVLTHDQLNSIANYLSDQTRLTRVQLVGVGVVCGLGVSVVDNTVRIKPGIGITTDGDLMGFHTEAVFSSFKLHDASNPRYEPFYNEDNLITLYELVRQGTVDPRATSLSQFQTATGSTLSSMVAVLYMESYVLDRDLCSGSDCDNLGQDCINTVKLLVVDKKNAESLLFNPATPDSAFATLQPIVINRPQITAATDTPGKIAQVFHDAAGTLHTRITTRLPGLFPSCSAFLADLFPSDPASGWLTRLASIHSQFNASNTGIQYWYDFLKDVAETWNDFHDLLFGDRTWCCPDSAAFPKHLLLGELAASEGTDDSRTGFYPSPATGRNVEQRAHARFLARKLHALINTFSLPTGTTTIRVTPCRGAKSPLEARAIPFYYQVNTTLPIHRSWNHHLHLRGMDAWNYSYNAGSYGAQGGAADPMNTSIVPFDFFRIEGHLGADVATVRDALEKKIADYNLPFAVRTAMLDPDKTKVVRKPGIRYTDLHRFHYMFRQDVVHQLDEVKLFSGKFKDRVDAAVESGTVKDSPDASDSTSVTQVAMQKNSAVNTHSTAARGKLNRTYAQYKADATWKSDVGNLMQVAGEFKSNLGKVVKTEFTTPFDGLIASPHIQWLDWLDVLIKDKEDKEDEKLLFSRFLGNHPGAEHAAGVPRGGTFVLLYDSASRVVADLALPYACCEEIEEEADEPPLAKPPVKPGWVIEGGINILPSLNTFVAGKLDVFKVDLEEVWVPKFDAQTDYFTVFKESVNLMGQVYAGTPGIAGAVAGVTGVPGYTDADLGRMVDEARRQKDVVVYYRDKAGQAGISEERRKVYEEQAREAEQDLAKSVEETTRYVADKGLDVSMGSQGMTAMMEMGNSVKVMRDATALETMGSAVNAVKEGSDNTGLNIMIDSMMRKR